MDCGDDIPGAKALLASGAVVMLGEMHGTAEIPAFVGTLACHAARAGLPVHLGLEIPHTEQAAIDQYLAGAGTDAAREALLAGAHWQGDMQDGRSSVAMLGLIEQMRRLRARGMEVAVFAFDVEAAGEIPWNERDAKMAERILARATVHPRALVLTLTGNLHNRKAPGLPWDDSLVPMGVHVAAGHARVTSLDVRYAAGDAWNCQQDGCGAHALKGKPEYREPRIDTSEAVRKPEVDGVFVVGPVSASPPAARRP